MFAKSRTIALAATLSIAIAACGDDKGTGPTGGGNSMSATLNGAGFQAPSLTVQANYLTQQQLVTVMGVQTSAGVTTTVTFNIIGVDGPGTYQISPNFAGTFGQVSRIQGVDVNSQQSWQTDIPGGSGTVQFSKLDDDGAEGTFSFTANPVPSSAATGQMQVQGGKFKVTFNAF